MAFKIPTTTDKRLSQADVISKVKEQPSAPVKKATEKKAKRKERPPKIARRSQVSLLLSEDEYAYVDELSYSKGVSMTRVVLNFLLEKGFFDD